MWATHEFKDSGRRDITSRNSIFMKTAVVELNFNVPAEFSDLGIDICSEISGSIYSLVAGYLYITRTQEP